MPRSNFTIVAGLTLLVVSATSILSQPTSSTFIDFVSKRFPPDGTASTKQQTASKTDITKFCDIDNNVMARRVFAEYGAMFVASNDVTLPAVCYLPDEKTTQDFQSKLRIKSAPIDGAEIKLQEAALNSLTTVVMEALAAGIKVSPFDGPIAAGRTYFDTFSIWNSRFEPALEYWTARGKITAEEAMQVRTLPIEQQVEKVIEWESQRLWFGTSHTASIFSSTAPPGASQHLVFIAFDVARLPSPRLIAIFNSRGWYQTVKGDPQHFTYLGLPETELTDRGLRSVYFGGVKYWLPNM